MTHPTLRRLGTTTFFFMALLAGAGAQARTDIGVSIGIPGVVVSPGYAPAPVYLPPPPVYYAPPPPVYRPPVYLQAPPVEYVPAPGYGPYYAVPRPRYYDDRRYPPPGYRRDRDHDGIPDRYDGYDNRREYYRR
ncbi:hypothetical protein ACSFA0_09220 [Variovorax sp. LT1P1]|uniref:hypothetical protein n=1 Tax=Variovorax sp. LT1P1 TaxID=3443730 RepID=UPI003F47A77F